MDESTLRSLVNSLDLSSLQAIVERLAPGAPAQIKPLPLGVGWSAVTPSVCVCKQGEHCPLVAVTLISASSGAILPGYAHLGSEGAAMLGSLAARSIGTAWPDLFRGQCQVREVHDAPNCPDGLEIQFHSGAHVVGRAQWVDRSRTVAYVCVVLGDTQEKRRELVEATRAVELPMTTQIEGA